MTITPLSDIVTAAKGDIDEMLRRLEEMEERHKEENERWRARREWEGYGE